MPTLRFASDGLAMLAPCHRPSDSLTPGTTYFHICSSREGLGDTRDHLSLYHPRRITSGQLVLFVEPFGHKRQSAFLHNFN